MGKRLSLAHSTHPVSQLAADFNARKLVKDMTRSIIEADFCRSIITEGFHYKHLTECRFSPEDVTSRMLTFLLSITISPFCVIKVYARQVVYCQSAHRCNMHYFGDYDSTFYDRGDS